MNKSIFIIVLLIISLFSCNKKTQYKDDNSENQDFSNKDLSIDYFRNVIKNAKDLNPETFIAIQAVHKEYILKTIEELGDISSVENLKVFEERKKAFFKDLFVTEEQIAEYFKNNIEKINQYAMEHPEVIPYLSMDN